MNKQEFATDIKAFEASQRETRKRVLAFHVCHALRETLLVQGITPETNVNDVRVEFTDNSLKAIAPLVEAVQILEEIIWASDGCVGHRYCAHSMEPWQRARDLLRQKWEADTFPRTQWPRVDNGA